MKALMHILILTANKVIKNLLHYVFLQSGCYCKTVDSLSCLFREIKNQVPQCIILDKDFFPPSYTRQEIRSCLHGSIFLEKFDFLIFLYDKPNAASFKTPLFKSASCTLQTGDAVKTILNNAVKKINAIDKDPQGFTPVEKKLYTLLKKRAEEELSLEEMCKELWGRQTDGNTKTLYTYIYKIKHILEKNESCCEMLVKAKKGRYKLTLEAYSGF